MNATTLEKMRKMKFFGMFRTFKTNLESGKLEDYTADEMIANLIEAEWDDRQNRNIERHLKNARFRYKVRLKNCITIPVATLIRISSCASQRVSLLTSTRTY